MQRLSSDEIDRVRVFLEETSVTCDLANFGTTILPAVQRLVPSMVACYAQVDPVTGTFASQELYPQPGIPGKGDADAGGLLNDHPVFQEWHRTGITSTIRRSDLLSRREWHRRGLYQNIYKQWGCEDSLPLALPAPNGLLACICSERDTDFTDTEVQIMEFIRPHVVQMYRNAELITLLSDAGPSERARSILLDRSGRPLVATKDSWDLIETYFPGHSSVNATFPVPVRGWLHAQLTRLQRAIEVPKAATPFIVEAPGGDRLVLRLLVGNKTGEQALLLLEQQKVEPMASVSPRFGLSAREEEVLLLVRRGLSSSQIADILFVSRRTVEKHLENIYCKLGVDNRTAALLVAFSPES